MSWEPQVVVSLNLSYANLSVITHYNIYTYSILLLFLPNDWHLNFLVKLLLRPP